MKKLLLFGAGKIGRSFIGQLFSLGGYEVVFVDVNKALIDALNKKGSYPVVIRSDEGEEVLEIRNIRGLYLEETEAIAAEFEEASVVATAVGNDNLGEVIPVIAKGIQHKIDQKSLSPTDIIIAENLRHAAAYFEKELRRYFPVAFIHQSIGLIETSIGKMVPIMTKKDLEEDITRVFAEPYNTLILDKKGFRNPLPDIQGLAPKENMKAWVDRKSFIHNLGHAAAAYFGYLKHPDLVYLYQVLEDGEVLQFTRDTMLQSGRILRLKYPEAFTDLDIREHIDDLIKRFRNRSLGDTVFRVGQDLFRKLDRNDRLAGAIHIALDTNKPYTNILKALVYGMHFRAKDEKGAMFEGDVRFSALLSSKGMEHLLKNICGFDPVIHPEVFILSKNYNIEVLKRFPDNN